jgi:hypothetical protein
MKSCSRCHEFKTLAEFDHSRSSRDGHHHRCKTCDRERDKQRLADGSLARSNRRWQAFHPHAVAAHKAVAAAVRRGEIVRGPCCVCGKPSVGKSSHGHHDNHRKKLDVIWFCKAHHDEHHRLERLNGIGQFTFQFWQEASK